MNGFSLPQSRSGNVSLVSAPPWHFGGEQIEVIYHTSRDAARSLVPSELHMDADVATASLVVSKMISTSDGTAYFSTPERAQYHECLLKILVRLRSGEPAWFVPISWVTKDFSLMRGSILGFGKRMAQITLTEFHELHPTIGCKKNGARMRGVCEAFGDTRIVVDVTLRAQSDTLPYTRMPFIVHRHYPTPGAAPDVDHFATLEVGSYVRGDAWTGTGRVYIDSVHSEIHALQPLEYLDARTFREGFTLHGLRTLTGSDI